MIRPILIIMCPMTSPPLTHLDAQGNVQMVDVGDKPTTHRQATAAGRVFMHATTLQLIAAAALPKGNVLTTAQLAGIMAAKRTSELIPLCHPLPLTKVDIQITLNSAESCLDIVAMARVTGQTGVEMEALTAVTVAALTIYDMVKAVDKAMTIGDIRLLEKIGGRSGAWSRE